MSDQQREHWSPTQLDLACKCGVAYERRYIRGEKIPPGIAAMKGQGMHGGAKTNMRQKIESHRDMPVKQIVEAAVTAFEDQVRGEYMLTREEQSRGPKLVLADAKDDVSFMAAMHAATQAPDYQPVLVEQKVRIELPQAPRDLLGIIDLADTKDRVIDFKTSGRRKNQAEADSSVQLTTYAVAFNALTGRNPSAVVLDTIVQTKTNTGRQALTSTRNSADYDALANRINAVQRMVDAGAFLPAMPGAWWCFERFCGFHATCKFVNHKRKSTTDDD